MDGPGHATVDEVRLVLQGPELPTMAAAFLFGYGHLAQCYDPSTGLVRDRATWPAADSAAVPAIGLFALASAVAADLGYVTPEDARAIVAKTTGALSSPSVIPRYRGLLPHFLKNGGLAPGTEWSSVDTAIALLSGILAAQSVGLDTGPLEAMLGDIDWSHLTDGFTRSASHGYREDGSLIESRWDTFGGESFLLATALAAALPGRTLLLERFPKAPTWDGSGFNDEIAALLFPMTGLDTWGNDWCAYRCRAFYRQQQHFVANPQYRDRGLLGLSASEVPEPWLIADERLVCGAWGVGGHNATTNDGSQLVGYPIVAPHYAAMVSAEHAAAASGLFERLALERLFTPLNNVESLGLPSGATEPRWNELKGSWNLGLRTLGAARGLSGQTYAPYRALTSNAVLSRGFNALMTRVGEPCSCSGDLPSRGGWRATLDSE